MVDPARASIHDVGLLGPHAGGKMDRTSKEKGKKRRI
jgi:hypothetical protein